MKYKSNKLIFAILLGMGLPLTQLQAQTVVAGDLILFFQQLGGTNTVYVNLGDAATLYRGAESGPSAALQDLDIKNIKLTLDGAFGTGWPTATDIYCGLAACANTSTTTVIPASGDQSRTLYVSRSRTSVGTLGASGSVAWAPTAGNNTSAASSMAALAANFALRLPNVDQGEVSTALSQIDDANPFLSGTIQGTGFTQFVGGVQQVGSATAFGTFGPAGSVEFAVDLQRLVPDGTVQSGEVSGPSRVGTYEGTITVAANGTVAFITQGVPSAYTDWAITNGVPGQAANLDHDNDSVPNGVEYFLVGPNTVSTGFTSSPGITTLGSVNSVTWTKAGTYTGVYGTDFWVETSTSLAAGSWTNETLGVNVVITGNNVKYTFPAGPVTTFARLKVTGP